MVETIVLGLALGGLVGWMFMDLWRLRDRVGKLVIDRSDLILRLDLIGREQNELIQRMDTAALMTGDESVLAQVNLLKERLLALERNAPEKGPAAVRGVVAARRMVADLGGAKDIQ